MIKTQKLNSMTEQSLEAWAQNLADPILLIEHRQNDPFIILAIEKELDRRTS